MRSLNPRWMKLGRDMLAARGRVAMMIGAVSVSLVAIGAVLGAYGVLTREITASYLGTRPASATLEVPSGITPALLAEVRRHPLVAEAEAREVVVARAQVGEDWRRTLLFVIDDFADLRLNLFRAERGAWPPPEGTMLLERSAVDMLQATIGQQVHVKTPNGQPQEVPVTGLVHDPGLAPAWQERSGYGYITRATLAQLGETPTLGELRVELKGRPVDEKTIETRAAELARWLTQQGHPVTELRVPPPAQHPHQKQMTTILAMMLWFSIVALVLSAILVANSLAAMLARQAREIGVMKTVGARTSQLARMYIVMVGALGAAALLLALPVGVHGARLFSGAISHMLNFDLASTSIPGWVFVFQATAALLVPLLIASVPVLRAARRTIRAALDDHGAPENVRSRYARLPSSVREPLRRPARLALTLGLLAAAGAMFMTAINVKGGWQANVDKVYAFRSYDVEVQLQAAQSDAVARSLLQLPQVRAVEAWGWSSAAFAQPGRIDVVRTYPDRGHGSLWVLAPPPETTMVRFPVKAGRWLRPGDSDAVVLNHVAAAQVPGVKMGDPITLSLGGRPTTWHLAGVVEEIGSPGAAYVDLARFQELTGTTGQARLLRVSTVVASPAERTTVMRAIDGQLAAAGAGVQSVIPLSEVRTAMGDHVVILIRALIAMAIVLAVVGMLGLASSMGTGVVERTRELAIMKTLGATPGRIVCNLVEEGVAIGTASWVLALAVSAPLTLLVNGLVGSLGFLAALPFVVSPWAVVGWLLLACAMSFGATLLPARRASALPVREALGRV